MLSDYDLVDVFLYFFDCMRRCDFFCGLWMTFVCGSFNYDDGNIKFALFASKVEPLFAAAKKKAQSDGSRSDKKQQQAEAAAKQQQQQQQQQEVTAKKLKRLG